MAQDKPSIALIGGTGDLGTGLARRWSKAGYPIIIGSRTEEKATTAAVEFKDWLAGQNLQTPVSGKANLEAAHAADIVALTIPFANHDAMVGEISDAVQGKILIDSTVPLVPPKVRTVIIPEGGSAAKRAQMRLGDEVHVVSAFQTVAAAHLADINHEMDCDILVCGNNKEARAQVIELCEAAGMRGWHAGRINNSIVSEGMTSILIFINGHYKIAGAGMRITGQPRRES